MSKQVSIAIIGGGASGTLTALHLLRKLNVPAKMYFIEKRKEATFRGHAYSSQLDYEPLNVQSGRMSLFSHLPDDFYNWVKSNKPNTEDITRDSFVSRRWFGDYLTEGVAAAAKKSAHVVFETITDEATSIEYDATYDAYSIAFISSPAVYCNYLIFATGNEPPADVFNASEIDLLNGHYISNPWATNPFAELNENDNVLIIGTGLTMVDHVISLYKHGHKGKIYSFSRNGYLPLPHADVAQNYVFEFNDEQKQLHGIFSEIKKNITAAGGKDIQWQSAIDAMRGKTTRIWKQMSTDTKRLFIKRLKTFWEIHRHRMPLASANTLNSMREAGQLELLSGKALGIEVNDKVVVFKLRTKNTNQERNLHVQRIINCTGPSGDYFKTGNTLLKNLLTKGWMKQDDLKIGLTTGVRGEIIRANGVVLQNAFSIGPLRKATEWESTALREIRTQAEETASYISSRIELNHDMMVEIGL